MKFRQHLVMFQQQSQTKIAKREKESRRASREGEATERVSRCAKKTNFYSYEKATGTASGPRQRPAQRDKSEGARNQSRLFGGESQQIVAAALEQFVQSNEEVFTDVAAVELCRHPVGPGPAALAKRSVILKSAEAKIDFEEEE